MPRKETPDERRERRAREADEARAKEAEQGIHRQPRGRPREGQVWDKQLGEWVSGSGRGEDGSSTAHSETAARGDGRGGGETSTEAHSEAKSRPGADLVFEAADATGTDGPMASAATPSGEIISLSMEDLRLLVSIRQGKELLTTLAAARAAAPAASATPSAAAAAPAAASSASVVVDDSMARASLIAKLQHAQKHWEACIAFDQETRPTEQVYTRMLAHHPRFYPPWCEWVQDYYRPAFPHINSRGACDDCIDAFIKHGDSISPCEKCLRIERWLCEAGGGPYPCYTQGRPSIAVPSFLLARDREYAEASDSE